MIAVLLPLLSVLILLQCGCSAQSRKTRHLNRAAEYFTKSKYDEAIVESMNVLTIENLNPTAIRTIALANSRLGKVREALPFLLKAAELEPTDTEVRLTLATIFTNIGERTRAREEALAVLDAMPTNILALFVLADTVSDTNEWSETKRILTETASALDKHAMFHIAVGNLALRSGNTEEARAAFLKARETDPESAPASLSMAGLHVLEGNEDMAAAEYELAVRQAPTNVMAKIKWANFEIRRGNTDVARDILNKVDQGAAEGFLAQFYLAKVELSAKNVDLALGLLDRALEKHPDFTDALFLKANAKVINGATDEGIVIYENLLRRSPKAVPIRYHLALALFQKRDVKRAIRELETVKSEAPRHTDAMLLLAQLYLQTGQAQAAIALLEPLAAKTPPSARTYALLAAGYASAGKTAEAETACRTAVELDAEDPRLHFLMGRILLAGKDTPGARMAFSSALEKAPRFTPALFYLVTLDLRDRKGDEAIARLNRHTQRFPDDAEAFLLLGRSHLVMGDTARGKEFLLKSIEIQPRLVGAYMTLGRLYASAGEIDDAIEKIEKARDVNPNNPSTLMLAAILYGQKGDRAAAIECYEKILASHSGFAAAANNLAYLYAGDPASMDRAYELAHDASEAFPEDPYIADTFGWILFLRGEHRWAANVLEKAKEALSDTPEALYHLGMARYAIGREKEAIETLRKALEGQTTFEGVERARVSLEAMTLDADPTGQEALARVDAMLAKDPKNLAATARRAAVLNLQGKYPEALAAYQSALDIAPAFTPAWLEVARLYSDRLDNLTKATEAAEEAKKLAPDDPETTGTLGWISYLRGDYKWALGLLQEAVSKRPEDPRARYALGMALYSQGDLDAATREVRHALAIGGDLPREADARRFLQMAEMYGKAETLREIPPDVLRLLETDPTDVPALMVAATVDRVTGQREQAVIRYEAILKQYPNFAPVRARLAELYAADKQTEDKAYRMAGEAREALPNDAQLARTLGRLAFARGEYSYAAMLLQESVNALPPDGMDYYCLGVSRYRIEEREPAKLALARALELSPDADFAEKARELLAELTEQPKPQSPPATP